jgi:hypothetical protein
MKPFSPTPKTGFTIWGVQPGDRVPELLANLPSGSSFHYDDTFKKVNQRRLVLENQDGRGLRITTQGHESNEVVVALRVFPASPVVTVEDDGKVLIKGDTSLDELKQKFGAPDKSQRFYLRENGQVLSAEYMNGKGLLAVDLSLK